MQEQHNILLANILNKSGDNVKSIQLSNDIFDVPFNKILLQECYEWAISNRRGKTTASTKTRGEVSYSNRKMRPQKRSGRARMGSRGVSHHRGGGVVHGPDGSTYSYTMPKKKVSKGMAVLLSAKYRENAILFIDDLSFNTKNTKEFVQFINNCNIAPKSVFISDILDENMYYSGRNIPNVDFLPVCGMNFVDLLKKKQIILSLSALLAINKKYGVDYEENSI